jgi:ferredoxin-NADP reductase/Fe-S-cluster-containing dehydrogenase component/CRP-like cAMP-binding protein
MVKKLNIQDSQNPVIDSNEMIIRGTLKKVSQQSNRKTHDEKKPAGHSKTKPYLTGDTSGQKTKFEATVIKTISQTHNTQSYHLWVSNPDFYSFQPGQFITVEQKIDNQMISRCYSISSSCYEKNFLEITVKKHEMGLLSNYFFEHLQTGEVLSLKKPKGGFTLDLEAKENLVLVGSGVGITPLISMVRSLSDQKSPRKIILLYGCRSTEDIIFYRDLMDLKNKNPNFSIQIFLSQSEVNKGYRSRRIQESDISQAIESSNESVSLYTCGPEALMDMAIRCAVDKGIPKSHSRKEGFNHSQKKTHPHSIRLEQVSSIDILNNLSEQNFFDIQPYIFNRKFLPREVVVREGDYGDSAFYILEGKARIYLETLELNQVEKKPQEKRSVWSRLKRLFSKNPHGYKYITAWDVPVTLAHSYTDGYACDADGQALRPWFLPAQVSNIKGQPVKKDKYITHGPGYLLGELSVLFCSTQSATVISDPDCNTPLRMVEIKAQGLRMLSRNNPKVKQFIEDHFRQQSLERFLKSNELFIGCDAPLIEQIIQEATFRSFKPHEVIQNESNRGGLFFVIVAGFVKLSKHLEEKELNFDYLEKGEFLGNSFSSQENNNICSAIAINHVQVIFLNDFLIQKLWKVDSFKEKVNSKTNFREEEFGNLQKRVSGLSLLNFGIENQLLNGESIMVINLDRCTHCDDCVQACADSHDGYPRFAREGKKIGNALFPHSCMHCKDPVCMVGCPSGALFRSSQNGEVLINLDTCVGCNLCVSNCIYENIVPLPVAESVSLEGYVEYQKLNAQSEPVIKAMKCDLCVETGSPACVRACPTDALHRLSFGEIFKAQM